MLPTLKDLKKSQISAAMEVSAILRFFMVKCYPMIGMSILLLLVLMLNSRHTAPLRMRIDEQVASLYYGVNLPLSSIISRYERFVNSYSWGADEISPTLRAENEQLKQKLVKLKHLSVENQQLRQLLHIADTTPYASVAAKVISENFKGSGRKLLINIGRNAGLEEGNVVLSQDGLIGRVVSLSDNSARVMALQDELSSIPAICKFSQERFIVNGAALSDRELQLSYSNNQNLVDGDEVYTTGDGDLLPKELFLGYIRLNGSEALLEASSQLKNLEYVLVLIKQKM